MLTKIKLLIFLSITLALNSCLTPLDDDGGQAGDIYVQPLLLQPGQSWVFNIGNSKYRDSFYVRESTPIEYNGRYFSVYRVGFPALHYLGSDTLLFKYWQMDTGSKLVEYGWEKRSRYNYDNRYDFGIYPESLVIADFSLITSADLFVNESVGIYQSGKQSLAAGGVIRDCLPVRFYCSEEWYGFPDCDYYIYFANGRIFDFGGRIRDVYFSAEPE